MNQNRLLRISLILLAVVTLMSASDAVRHNASASSPPLESATVEKLHFIFRTVPTWRGAGIRGELDATGTDNTVIVGLNRQKDRGVRVFEMPSAHWDENEAGRTEFYTFGGNIGDVRVADFTDRRVCLSTNGNDAWLPADVVILGKVGNELVLLNANLGWGDDNSSTGWWISNEYESAVDAIPMRNLMGNSCGFDF